MSDPSDMIPAAGSGAAGGTLLGILISRLFPTTGLDAVRAELAGFRAELATASKEQSDRLGEFKADMKASLIEQRADTREQIASLKEMVARGDERHDRAIRELGLLDQKATALHGRIDQLTNELKEIERRIDRLENEVAR